MSTLVPNSLRLALTSLSILAALVAPGLSDPASPWELHNRNGAGGTLHTSTLSRVSKTNAVGLLNLTWTTPFTVQSNRHYLVRLPYHTEDASLANLLLLRTSHSPADLPKLDAGPDAFALWTAQSLVRNSAPGQSDTRLYSFRATHDGPLTVHAVLYGNPFTVELGAPTIEDQKVIRPKYKDYSTPFTVDEVNTALAGRKPAAARVARHKGRPTLFLNGQPVPPLLYKGVNATKSYGDYAAFAADGINLATVCIATGDTTDPHQADTEPVWLGKDRFALERIEAALLRALRRNTNAQLILDIRITPYKAWGTEHPDDIIRNIRGERAYAPTDYVGKFTSDTNLVDPPDSGKWWYPSWQSEAWRADLERVFTRIAEHVKTSPYGKAVVGFFITGNDDGQFVVHYHDHSEPTQRAFRRWLLGALGAPAALPASHYSPARMPALPGKAFAGKYSSLDELNRVWKTSFINANQIKVPAQEWPSAFTHYAPGPQPDFREFKECNPWEVRERLAAALKRAIGRPVVAMAYAAPYYHALVDCPSLDAVGMQPDYAHRRNGFPIAFHPVSADDVGPRLLFTELDLRSNTGEAWPTTPAYLEWVSSPSSAAEWRHIHRKVTGFSRAAHYADWYYDMGQYFNDPDVHAEIAAQRRVAERLLRTRRSKFRPDVCVVVTETDRHYLAHDEAVIPYDEVNFNPQMLALASCGVPFEKHYLKDIVARPHLQDFKVYVFLQNAFLTATERRFIQDTLQAKHRTLVWVYNSGYLSDAGKSVDAMSDLIRIRLATDEKPARQTMLIDHPSCSPAIAGSAGASPATDGRALSRGGETPAAHVTPPQQSSFNGAEMYFTIFNWGAPGVQPFRVEDPDATPLGHYAETGEVAAARRQFKTWSSVYLGAAQGLGPELLHHLATEAGAYVAGPPGHQLNLNGEFASLHALRSGTYTLTLPPGRTRVLDADTGRVLARRVRHFTFPVTTGQTHWFLFE